MPSLAAYQRVADELRNRVLSGLYPSGSRMPSLREVDGEFGVSQATSRAAYQVLISEGLVEGRFGGGYYVRTYRPIIRHSIQRLAAPPRDAGNTIWDADPGTAGRNLIVDNIEVSSELPPGDVARELNLSDDARTVVRRRRYVLDDKPVLISTSYFPSAIAADTPIAQPDTGPGGAYARLADLGRAPQCFQEDVASRMPTPAETEQLQLPPATPVLTIRRTVWGPASQPLEVNTMVGDAASYVLRYRWNAE